MRVSGTVFLESENNADHKNDLFEKEENWKKFVGNTNVTKISLNLEVKAKCKKKYVQNFPKRKLWAKYANLVSSNGHPDQAQVVRTTIHGNQADRYPGKRRFIKIEKEGKLIHKIWLNCYLNILEKTL